MRWRLELPRPSGSSNISIVMEPGDAGRGDPVVSPREKEMCWKLCWRESE
jgi:hypothetical protein